MSGATKETLLLFLELDAAVGEYREEFVEEIGFLDNETEIVKKGSTGL